MMRGSSPIALGAWCTSARFLLSCMGAVGGDRNGGGGGCGGCSGRAPFNLNPSMLDDEDEYEDEA